MSSGLTRVRAINFRCLKDVTVDLRPVSVFFGGNGAGKSTLLDLIWFVRDCAIRGAIEAASTRSHGIGLRWDGAEEGSPVVVGLDTESVSYQLEAGFSSGRMEPFVGECLTEGDVTLLVRHIGADRARFSGAEKGLRAPEKTGLSQLVNGDAPPPSAVTFDHLLHRVRRFNSRDLNFYKLRTFGSETSHHVRLSPSADNLWSVLRNLNDSRDVDERYSWIMDQMRRAFPLFQAMAFSQTGNSSV